MLKRVVPKRAVLRRARAGPGRAARLATYSVDDDGDDEKLAVGDGEESPHHGRDAIDSRFLSLPPGSRHTICGVRAVVEIMMQGNV